MIRGDGGNGGDGQGAGRGVTGGDAQTRATICLTDRPRGGEGGGVG
jgi:hypothetical protein